MCNFWQSCAKMSTLRVRADLVDRWLIIRLAFRALVAHQWPMAHHPGSDGSLAPARKEAWPEPAEREGNDMCYSVVSAAASDHNALCTCSGEVTTIRNWYLPCHGQRKGLLAV